MKTVGQKIREAREAKELTTEQLAKKLVISPGYLGHLERDSHVRLSERVEGLLRQVLGVTFAKAAVEAHNERSTKWYRKYHKSISAPAKKAKAKTRRSVRKAGRSNSRAA